MDAYQQRFHDFLMSMVQSGNESAAEAILARSFAQQDAGSFTLDAIDAAVDELTPLVKAESVVKLQDAAQAMRRQASQG